MIAYDLTLDAVEAGSLIESPSQDTPMKMSNGQIVSVKGQFIEQVREGKMALSTGGNLYARYFIESIDPIVSNWASRVVTNGGSTPLFNTQLALSAFVRGLRSDGLLSAMSVVNCYAPDSLTAAITPLIVGVSNDPWTNHSFVSGDLSVNGLKGDGSSKYLDPNIFLGSTSLTSTSAGCTVYCYDAPSTVNNNGYALGVGGAANSSQFGIVPSSAGTSDVLCWRFINTGTDCLIPIQPSAGGYFSGNRTAANAIALYYANGSNAHSALATGTGTQTGAIITDFSVIAHAVNALGTVSNYSNARLSFMAIHLGLTSTQSSNFFTRVQTMRTALNGGFV